MLIDTHAHIDFFENPDLVIKEANEAGVLKIVIPGVEPSKFQEIINLCEKYENLYCALGVHPSEAHTFNDTVAGEILKLAKHKKVVALGEIGLDYYYDKDTSDVQKRVFKTQLELASALNLPVIIHNREAHKDTFDILREYEMKHVILHCYTGSIEFARECLKEGWMFGFGGVVTFKNAKKVKETVKELPIECIVLETDCPYLAPHPFRGEQNAPKYIPFIAKEIANLKEMRIQDVQEVTSDNAMRFFNIV